MVPVTTKNGPNVDGPFMDLLPERLVENWISYLGPHRSALFAPLRSLLIAPPDLPSGCHTSVGPAIRLLAAVGRGEVRLNKRDEIVRGVAANLNNEVSFVFPSPPADAVEDSWLEVDALLVLLRVIEATDPLGWRETLSPHGRAWIEDPQGLWMSLTGAFGAFRPSHLFGDFVESMLAWLIQADAGFELMHNALQEALAVRGSEWHGEDPEELLEASALWMYTNLRALNLLVPPNQATGHSKPVLTPTGRAGVIRSLRAAAASSFCSDHALRHPD